MHRPGSLLDYKGAFWNTHAFNLWNATTHSCACRSLKHDVFWGAGMQLEQGRNNGHDNTHMNLRWASFWSPSAWVLGSEREHCHGTTQSSSRCADGASGPKVPLSRRKCFHSLGVFTPPLSCPATSMLRNMRAHSQSDLGQAPSAARTGPLAPTIAVAQ